MSATGSSDPDTAAGDGIRNYVWTWGDGTADTTGTSASQSHVYAVAGTYTVTLRVLDKWGRSSAAGHAVGDDPGRAGRQHAADRGVQHPDLHRSHLCRSAAPGRTDSDGGIRSYTWKWGDGTADSTTTSANARARLHGGRDVHDHAGRDGQLGQDQHGHPERDGRLTSSYQYGVSGAGAELSRRHYAHSACPMLGKSAEP